MHQQRYSVGRFPSVLTGVEQGVPVSSGVIDTELISPSEPVLVNENMSIQAIHTSQGISNDNISVLFYNGDPEQGGVLFDMEIIPRIQADSPLVTRVPFQPDSCGNHTLFVQVIPGNGSIAPVMDYTKFQVTIDPREALPSLINSIKTQELPRWMKKKWITRLKAAQTQFRRGRTNAGLDRLHKFAHRV